MKKINSTLLGLFVYLFISFFCGSAYADVATSDNWSIEIKDLNLTSDTPVSNQKKQLITDQPSVGTYSGTNYTIKTGFDQLDPSAPFSFSISNSLIDYGPLSPTNQIYRTSNLSITNDNIKSFIVTAYANHPLATTGLNSSIPDSTCDNGSCSEVTAAPWTNTLTYGFGYRCDNINENKCPVDFKQSDYYKQFSDSSKNETSQILMSSNVSHSNPQVQITYKVNISKTQADGPYANTITYIAAPGY